MTQVNAAQDEAWWEEFMQSYGKESLRSLAKRFETTPRRLRRAAQRCGLADEPEAIKTDAARLGAAPDASLAEAWGVTPEQVKGARTRRGIKAFNPRTEPQPKKPRPKKPKPPRSERPERPERRFRTEPTIPTVVVKRSRSRVPSERPPSRVEDSGRRLADTLGRISHEDPSSPDYEEASRREAREARRRRILGPDRLEELRGLKPSVADTSRSRRRRLPRASEHSEGDDDPTGAARERITRSLKRAQATPEPEPIQVTAPKPRATLRRPSRPIPKFVVPAPVVAPVASEQTAAPVQGPVQELSEAMSASVASQGLETVKVQQRSPAPKPRPSSAQASLWTALYRESGKEQTAVIAAPSFVSAIERARGLGELISLSPAELL